MTKSVFVQGTVGECDFIEKEINYDKSLKIIFKQNKTYKNSAPKVFIRTFGWPMV